MSIKSEDYKEKKIKKAYNSVTNKPCVVYSKDNVKIRTFKTIREASLWTLENSNAITIKGISTHIKEVCEGKRKTAYGYKWEYN